MTIGRNQKLRNLENFRFSPKSYLNFLVFVSVHFFGVFKSLVTTSANIWSKQNFQDLRVFDLGYRSKSKIQKSRKFFIFSFNSYWNLSVFRWVHIFVVFKSWVLNTVRVWKKRHISEIFEFLILGKGQKRKLGNLENFYLFIYLFIYLSHLKFLLVK